MARGTGSNGAWRLALLAGIAATVVGLSKVHAAWVAPVAYDYSGSFRFGWSVAYALVLYVLAYGAGLPDLPPTRRSGVLTSAVVGGLGALVVSIVQLAAGDALLPRFVVLGTALAVIPLGTAANALARRGADRAGDRDRVVLVGETSDAVALEQELAERTPERPARLVAHLTTEAAAHPGGPLIRAVEEGAGTVVVLSRTAQGDERIVAQAAVIHERGVRVRTLSLFYEEWLAKLPMSELERVSLMFDIGGLHRSRYAQAKRVLDVAGGLLGLVPLVLLLPVVLVGNRIANRGPLLYRQERVGRFGSRFTILKLRTMRPHERDGMPDEWTTEDDPRITPFGRFLRRTHLDELPQVVNVLRGDLSLVGPRPEQPHYVEELTDKLNFYKLRHLVRPGLTGWAQVMYGYAGDETDALEKLQYEFFYLRHQGVRFDLRIVGRTLRSVTGLAGGGR